MLEDHYAAYLDALGDEAMGFTTLDSMSNENHEVALVQTPPTNATRPRLLIVCDCNFTEGKGWEYHQETKQARHTTCRIVTPENCRHRHQVLKDRKMLMQRQFTAIRRSTMRGDNPAVYRRRIVEKGMKMLNDTLKTTPLLDVRLDEQLADPHFGISYAMEVFGETDRQLVREVATTMANRCELLIVDGCRIFVPAQVLASN